MSICMYIITQANKTKKSMDNLHAAQNTITSYTLLICQLCTLLLKFSFDTCREVNAQRRGSHYFFVCLWRSRVLRFSVHTWGATCVFAN